MVSTTTVVRSSSLEFFGAEERFSFVCNRALDKKPWTPGMLKQKLGVTNFPNLVSVIALVTSCNLEPLMSIVEEWNGAKMPVVMVFPNHRVRPQASNCADTVFGVPVDQCYEPAMTGGFTATSAFRQNIAAFFKDDRLVTVEV